MYLEQYEVQNETLILINWQPLARMNEGVAGAGRLSTDWG